MPTTLTDLQLAIMRVLWTRGEATVFDVQDGLRPERDLANATIATILSRLERRGVVSHRAEGRQYVYAARVTESEVRRSMVAELTQMLFGGSSTALVNHLLNSHEISEGDLDRVKQMIADEDRDGRAHDDR
jgi:BlaI family penicillinase repressor